MFHHHLNIASFLWGLLKLSSAVFKNKNTPTNERKTNKTNKIKKKNHKQNQNLMDHENLFGVSPLKAAVALLVLQPG